MDEKHKTLLRSKRTYIMDNLTNPEAVVDKLFEKNVFTNAMKQDVAAIPTQTKQARKILDFLPTRGSKAFDLFVESLIETSNDAAADCLELKPMGSYPDHSEVKEMDYAIPTECEALQSDREKHDMVDAVSNDLRGMNIAVERTGKDTRDEEGAFCDRQKDTASQTIETSVRTDNPEKSSNDEDKLADLSAQLVNLQIKNGISYYDYNGERGLLLILNATENREGTGVDVKKLQQFFKGVLNFEVEEPQSVYGKDLSREEIKAKLEEVRKKLHKTNYYCFICVILSHGDEAGIQTKEHDPEKIKLKENRITEEEIRETFNNYHTPNFIGRPKIFLLQACRGLKKQRGLQIDSAGTLGKDNLLVDKQVLIPEDADTLFAFPTTQDCVAYRCEYRGSWFIGACIKTFEDYYKYMHLEDMLITVREKVAVMNGEIGTDVAIQMPCVWSTLTKRLLLRKYKSNDVNHK